MLLLISNILYSLPQNSNDSLIEQGHKLLIYNKIDSAIVVLTKANKTSLKTNNNETTIKSLLLLCDAYRKKNDYNTSKSYLNKIDTTILNKYTSLKADYIFRQGKLKKNHSKSIKILKNSIEIKKKHKDNGITSLSNYYNGLGTTFLYMAKKDSALKYYNRAINEEKSTTNSYKKEFNMAAFYLNKGIINASNNRYEVAIKYFRKSIYFLEKNKKNTIDVARYNTNIGRLYFLTFQFDSAEINYKKAEYIYSLLEKNNRDAGVLFLNMGGLYSTTNNIEKALRYYNKAKYIFINNPRYSSYSKRISLNLGVLHEKENEYKKAISLYKSVFPVKRKSTEIKTHRNLGTCYSELGIVDSASFYFNKAILSAKNTNNNFELALSYLYFGQHLSKNNNQTKALLHINKAISIHKTEKKQKNKNLAYAFLKLSQHYRRYNDFKNSIKYADLVLKELSSNSDSTTTESYLRDTKIELNKLSAMAAKARSYYSMGINENNNKYLVNAFEIYKKLLSTIEFIRINHQHEENKLALAEKAKTEYSYIIRTLKSIYENTGEEKYQKELFRFMEKSKSAILYTSINESRAKITAGIPDSLSQKEKFLKNKIASYKRMVYEKSKKNPNSKVIPEWENRIFQYESEYENLVKYFEINYEKYYKLKYSPEIVDINHITERINNDQAVIEYTVTSDELFIFVIKKDKHLSYSCKLAQDSLNNIIGKFRNSLTIQDFANFNREEYDNYTTSSYHLYNILIKPIKKEIANKELIIIPDDRLGYIPFDILLTDKHRITEKINYKNLPYLLFEHTISYAYSASLLFEDIEENNPKYNKVFSIAPSYDNIKAIHVDSLFKEPTHRNILLPIPGVKDEVKNISEIFESNKLMDKEATEKAFKKEASKYGILHLAMHTIVNDEFPMFSKLIFYQNDDTEEDGLLNTYEIFDLKLNAELAVLSACNTGYGKLRSGEGIISLARGFIYAGVPSIVMTLWPIEDHATSDLMKLFYENIAAGMRKHDALKKARIDFLQSADQLRSHPHFWGSIVPIGVTTPITKVDHKRNNLTLILSILSILIVAGIIFYKKRDKK